MNNFEICLIDKSFFEDFPNLKAEANTKESRMYLGIRIHVHNNNCFVPFESNLFEHPALKKHAQFDLPSQTRPNAGLNFEKCLIINDQKYIEVIEHPKLAHSQYKKLEDEQELIKEKLQDYIDTYIKACKKNREGREFIFKYTTLHKFKTELGINISEPKKQ